MNFRKIDPILVIGTVISIAVAIILVLTGQDQAISLLIGFAITIITMLIDIIGRIEQTRDKLADTQKLNDQLNRDQMLFQSIKSIVDDYFVVSSKKFNPFTDRANDLLIEYRNTLRNLSQGRMKVDFSSKHTYGHKGLISAKKTVKAVAYANPSYWKTDYAKGYMETNKNIVQKGVIFTRIWLQPRETLDDLSGILKIQREMGIKLYQADPKEVPQEVQIDFVIIDDKIIVTLELAPDGKPKFEIISIDDTDVSQALYKFDLLLRYSRPVEI